MELAKQEGIKLGIDDVAEANELVWNEMKPAQKLLAKIFSNEGFKQKILLETDHEKIIQIAKEEGIEFKNEDIDEANELLAKMSNYVKDRELSDEELEMASGGQLGRCLLGGVGGAVGGYLIGGSTREVGAEIGELLLPF